MNVSIELDILARYARNGASSRLRTLQYEEYLRDRNLNPAVHSFFDAEYLKRLYLGRPSRIAVVSRYLRRVGDLKNAGRADVIWLEKEALPWLPWAIEEVLIPDRVPLVVDYDDAVFHRYDLHQSALVRRFLGKKLDKLMASASLITAGNRYLAERAYVAGATRVEIVPTVVDLRRYNPTPKTCSISKPKVGWIGTPSTWTEYMAPMLPLLVEVASSAGGRILAIGAGSIDRDHPILDSLPWTEESEVTNIQKMDIGIMPLTDTPWARGKCGYKLIQYMACGVPVVASPIGVNADIVEHGVNGFLASTESEWRTALQLLLNDPGMRARMGAEGRRKVVRDYSLQVWGPRVSKMLCDVACHGNRD